MAHSKFIKSIVVTVQAMIILGVEPRENGS